MKIISYKNIDSQLETPIKSCKKKDKFSKNETKEILNFKSEIQWSFLTLSIKRKF